MVNLLELPAELRLKIYELVAGSCTINLTEDKPWPALCSVNRDVCLEVLPVMFEYAAIEVFIHDMDFTRVIQTVQPASIACRKGLARNSRVTLYLDYYSDSVEAQGHLFRWLDFCKTPPRDFPLPRWEYKIVDAWCRGSVHTDTAARLFMDRTSGYWLLHEIFLCTSDEAYAFTLTQILSAFWGEQNDFEPYQVKSPFNNEPVFTHRCGGQCLFAIATPEAVANERNGESL